ncbi:Uncharacterised protein at_DN0409 [Pycnogonum litorale]
MKCSLPESGMVRAFIGAASLTLMHLFVSILTSEMHPFQISACSDTPAALIALSYCLITKTSLIPEPGERIYSAVYVISLSLTILSTDFSLFFVPPFDSEAIIATNIVFVAAVSSIFLGELIDFIDLTMICVSFIGVVLITQPSFLFQKADTTHSWFDKRFNGSMLALLASLSIATLMCANRRIRRTSPFTLMFAAYGLAGLFSCIAAISFGQFRVNLHSWTNIVLPILVTVTDLSAQYFIIRATQVETATSVSLIVMLNLPLILLLQLAFLRIVPDSYSFAGAAAITFVLLVTAVKPVAYRRYGIEQSGICLRRRRESTQFADENAPYESIEES